MQLTVEKNKDAIRRYGHIKPAARGLKRCGTRFPGTARACTLGTGHRGAHVAHGSFGKVLAVWDSAVQAQGPAVPAPRPSSNPTRVGSGKGDLTSPAKNLVDFFKGVAPSMETAFFLLMFVAMVGFVIDWALRIAGLR